MNSGSDTKGVGTTIKCEKDEWAGNAKEVLLEFKTNEVKVNDDEND